MHNLWPFVADTLHLCTDLYDAKSNFLQQQQQQQKQRRQDNNNGNVRVHVSCPSSRSVLSCTVLFCAVRLIMCVCEGVCVCGCSVSHLRISWQCKLGLWASEWEALEWFAVMSRPHEAVKNMSCQSIICGSFGIRCDASITRIQQI